MDKLALAKLSKNTLPPLPDIPDSDVLRQVFTHRSVYARPTHQFEDPEGDLSPDNEKLEHIGDAVLGLCTTHLIRNMYPRLQVGPATKVRSKVVDNPTVASLAVAYSLHTRLQVHAAQALTLRTSIKIRADVFESYVGGLYITSGFDVVRIWLTALLTPYVKEAYAEVRAQYGLPPSNHEPEPERDSSAIYDSPPSTSAQTSGHLSLFNQYIQQNGIIIQWIWSDSELQAKGPNPKWVAKVLCTSDPKGIFEVDKGEQGYIGVGMGRTKKAAQNEAAQKALGVLGILA
ncbi:hypothetical protein M422DRAFT_233987 [Sphaerobolus stellatus SS14]|uniref:Uncharacterized protein n=1 Tax=Sphaerobolus stellatus (strain SS14) TaxID=990650 RepID=A0A0C9V5L6_SPHS4|nr:hypothetical protein M422DRAFT_233987 [Sphaerobolus stellatus SS14]